MKAGVKRGIKNNRFLVKILMFICRVFRYNKFKIKGKNYIVKELNINNLYTPK